MEVSKRKCFGLKVVLHLYFSCSISCLLEMTRMDLILLVFESEFFFLSIHDPFNFVFVDQADSRHVGQRGDAPSRGEH